MRTPLKLGLLVGIGIGALSLAAPAAHAFVSTLTATNDADLGAGPFGTVTVTLTNNNTTAHIVFDALPNYYFIDSSIADVNINTSGSFTVSGFSATAAPGSTGT